MPLLDFDERVRRLIGLDRIPLIHALIDADAQMEALARAGARAKRGTVACYRAEEARDQVARFGRLIHFLRFRMQATGATVADLELCDMLAEKLRAKGQREGEYSL